jgi:hypothetical protein
MLVTPGASLYPDDGAEDTLPEIIAEGGGDFEDYSSLGALSQPDILSAPAGALTIEPTTTAVGTGSFIDLTAETIAVSGFTVAAFSVDGGSKWRRGPLPTDSRRQSALFNKDLELWVSNVLNDRGKAVTKAADINAANTDNDRIIKFPKINARPRGNEVRLRPLYRTESDLWTVTGEDPAGYEGRRWDYWALQDAEDNEISAETRDRYQYAQTSDGKPPAVGWTQWKQIPERGFEIGAQTEARAVFFISTAPAAVEASDGSTTYTPRSQIFRIAPANLGRAPNYRVNYRSESLRLRSNDFWSVDGGETWNPVVGDKPEPLVISDEISLEDRFLIRRGSVGRRPRTESQALEPLRRLRMSEDNLNPAGNIPLATGNGRITTDLKAYEVLDTTRTPARWGRVPRVTTAGVHSFPIRLRATPRESAVGAWSAQGTLEFTVGAFNPDRPARMGVMPEDTENNIEGPHIKPPVLPKITARTPDSGFLITAGGFNRDLSITACENTTSFRWLAGIKADGSDARVVQRTPDADGNTTNTFTLPAEPGPGPTYYIARAQNAAGVSKAEFVVMSPAGPFRGLSVPEPKFGVKVEESPGTTENSFFTIDKVGANDAWTWSSEVLTAANPNINAYPGNGTHFSLEIKLTAKGDYRFEGIPSGNATDVLGEIFPGSDSITATLNGDSLTLLVTYGDMRDVITNDDINTWLAATVTSRRPTAAGDGGYTDYFVDVSAVSEAAPFTVTANTGGLGGFWNEVTSGVDIGLLVASLNLIPKAGFKFHPTSASHYIVTVDGYRIDPFPVSNNIRLMFYHLP